MIRRRNRIVWIRTITFVVFLTLFITPTTSPALADTEDSKFPFTSAKMIYNVEGNSTLGYLIGTLTYTVEEVAGSTYTVKINSEGNIDKLPNLINQETRELDKTSPLFFSRVIEDSNFEGKRTLEVGERNINVNEYYLEKEKEYGTEKTTVFLAEEVKIPLIVKYSYGDRFRLTIELTKTNVKYLQ